MIRSSKRGKDDQREYDGCHNRLFAVMQKGDGIMLRKGGKNGSE